MIYRINKALHSKSKGYSTFSIGFFSVFLAMVGAVTAPQIKKMKDEQRAAAAGKTNVQARDELERYVRDNFSSIYSAAQSAPILITVADLADAGFLDRDRITGTGSSRQHTNELGQSFRAFARRTPSNNLSVLMTTMGPAMSRDLAVTAAKMDLRGGGFVANSNRICGALPRPCVVTNYRGRTINLQNYAGTITTPLLPGAGQVTSSLFFGSNGAVLDPFLYRADIGDPNANTMATNIDMGGNSIVNVDDICLTSIGKCVSAAFEDRGTVPHNALVAKPICPANNPTPKITTSPQVVAGAGTADLPPISAFSVYPQEAGANWRIIIEVLTEDGIENPDPTIGRAIVETFCTI